MKPRHLVLTAIAVFIALHSSAHAYPVLFARMDLNGDGRVNASDLELMTDCRTASGLPASAAATCRLSDADRDSDVDMNDFGEFQRCYGGTAVVRPDCAGLLNRFDFDGNGRVDSADLTVMIGCNSGPSHPAAQTRSCRLADADGDGDVDSSDFGGFQACYNPALPANPFCPAPTPPHGTVTQATGIEDTDLIITLAGVDPYDPAAILPATITTQPSVGALFQFNGDPILAAPADVTDQSGRVKFRTALDGYGAPYASFAYTVFSAYSSTSSAPRAVSISITNVNDPPLASMSAPVMTEDTPGIIVLGGTDPDLPNDTLRAKVLIAPNLGASFYQVDPDGTPRPDLPKILNGAQVTNPDRKVYFVPPANYYTNPLIADVNFRYALLDAANVQSFPLNVLITVLPVNDPPVAYPGTFVGANTQTSILIRAILVLTDVEAAAGQGQSLTACIDALPQHGTLYQTTNGSHYLNPVTQTGVCVSPFELYYVRDDWKPFDCGPDDPPSSYPREDSFALHGFDGVDAGNTLTYPLRTAYFNSPPVFTGPAQVNVMEDSFVTFAPTATDIDGHVIWFAVAAPLPTRGTLYFHTDEYGEVPVAVGQFTPEFPTRFTYIPLPDENTAGGPPDVIHLQAIDIIPPENPGTPRDCDNQIAIVIDPQNDPPGLTGVTAAVVDVTTDTPPVALPVTITSLHVTDDALPAELLKVTLSADGTYADHISLNTTAGLASVQQVSPKVIEIEGTLAALNAAFAAGVKWWPGTIPPDGEVTSPHHLVATVNDQGHAGAENPPVPLTATHSIDMNFDNPGTLPLDP